MASRQTILKTIFRLFSILLLPLAAAYAIFWLVRDSSQLFQQSIYLNPGLVGLSFLVECSGLLIAIPTWRHILGRFGVQHGLADDCRIYCYSALGVVLPGGIWSIVSRASLYQKLGSKGLPVAAASVVETLVIGVAALAVYSITAILNPELSLFQRPEVGIIFSLLALVLIQPRVFNRLLNWALIKSKSIEEPLQVNFNMKDLASWIVLEMAVTTLGGAAVFTLLASLAPGSSATLIPAVAAWAAASATSNLFFWLPGTPILRDGAMVLAFTPSLTLPVALIFVVLVRLWTMASILVLVGLTWLTLDLPKRLKKSIPG
jgi:hypothetical protein